jgi:hypothetical protein
LNGRFWANQEGCTVGHMESFVGKGLGYTKVMGVRWVAGSAGDRFKADGEIWMLILWGWERGGGKD